MSGASSIYFVEDDASSASGALRSAPVLALPGGGQTAGYGKVASSRSGAGE